MYVLKFTFPFLPNVDLYGAVDGNLSPNWDKVETYSNLITVAFATVVYRRRFLNLPSNMRPTITRIAI